MRKVESGGVGQRPQGARRVGQHVGRDMALRPLVVWVGLACAAVAPPAHGQPVAGGNESIDADFTSTLPPAGWIPQSGACLTAGPTPSPYASTSPVPLLTIPACGRLDYQGARQVGGANNQLGVAPDPDGSGALRLTNGQDASVGAIVSQQVLAGNRGINIEFTSVTYAGDGYPDGRSRGADGINFFITNAGETGEQSSPLDPDPQTRFQMGAYGGALGYTCHAESNNPSGISDGFLGLGIDEYGHYLSSDIGSTGNPGVSGNRIGIRGPGNANWRWMRATYPQYYAYLDNSPSGQMYATRDACRRGYVTDYRANPYAHLTDLKIPSYEILPGSTRTLPNNTPVASSQVRARVDAPKIDYSLRITPEGLLTFQYAYNGGAMQPILIDQDITKSSPLPKFMRFGFASSTGAGNNVHEILCFKAATDNASTSSAALNLTDGGELRTDTQIFLASFNRDNWWGTLTARTITFDPATGIVGAGPVNWDAGCVLTGGKCATLGGKNVPGMPPAQRNFYTWNGMAGVALEYTALSVEQRKALDADGKGEARLRWLKGQRSDEYNFRSGTGTFRERDGLLGDVQGSSPVAVVDPAPTLYPDRFKDLRHPDQAAPETAWSPFARRHADRAHVVYVGANDGFLHAFRAGRQKGGTFDSRDNDGRELFAYMPDRVVRTIHSATEGIDLSHRLYAHAYYVDAQPVPADLHFDGSWHTWLVGGLGAGGRTLYALDVTDPESFGPGNILGEWNETTVVCASDPRCGESFGKIYGTPAVRRLHDGAWAVLFGNGLDSSTGTAGLFIMRVDPNTGNTSFRFLDTSTGAAGGPRANGIAHIAPADLDGDRITDFVYGGDLLGNIWRFDLTSSNPDEWGVTSYTGSALPAPLASMPGVPLSGRPAVVAVQTPGSAGERIMIAFGSGRRMEQTLADPVRYAGGQHAISGVWDWKMEAWNQLKDQSYQFLSLPSFRTTTASDLRAQSLVALGMIDGGGTSNVLGRSIDAREVCWKGAELCQGANEHLGWTIPLPVSGGASEQIVSNATVFQDVVFMNTLIPPSTEGASCKPKTESGYTMSINLANGGAPPRSVFAKPPTAIGGRFVAGLKMDGVGTPTLLTATDQDGTQRTFMADTTQSGAPNLREVIAVTSKGKRTTWAERR